MADYWSTSDVDLHLDVDPATGRRSGLEHALREAIRDGRLRAGTKIPSTRTLAAELGLSRGTVSAAYDQLTAEGHLVARQGSGTRVAELGAGPADDDGGVRDVGGTGDLGDVHGPGVPADRGPSARPADLLAAPRRYRHDLKPGSPDLSRFPIAAWLRASRKALDAAPRDAFGYGDPRGRIELRTALAGYLGRTRGVLATPDRIVVTTGAIQALSLISSVLAADTPDGTPAVAMEDPCIPLFRSVVRRAGSAVRPLPVDDEGACVAALTGSELAGVRAAVVTPSHQYPIGSTLHPARRQALAEWARGGHLVVEDDYDGEFRYDRQPVGAIQGIAPDDVIYLGTAAKTLGPAVRLAWLVLPPALVGPVTEAKRLADHQSESLGQLTLAELIASHEYDRHIRACRLRYRRRRDLLADRLKPRGGRPLQGFALGGIAAGLHALIRLEPVGLTEAEVVARAAEYDLAIEGLGDLWHAVDGEADEAAWGYTRGGRSSVTADPARPQGIVVGFGSPTEAGYPAALDALVRALSWG